MMKNEIMKKYGVIIKYGIGDIYRDRHFDEYYEIVRGNVTVCDSAFFNRVSINFLAQKMKFVFDYNDIEPYEQCKNKLYYNVKVYKLMRDDDCKPIKYKGLITKYQFVCDKTYREKVLVVNHMNSSDV